MSDRSKNIIANTLIEIIKTESFADITISEICDKSPLVRKTFYNNFKSKNDIIIYVSDKLLKEFVETIHRDGIYTLSHISLLFFKFGLDNKDILILFRDNSLLLFFTHVFNQYLPHFNNLLRTNKRNVKITTRIQYVHAFHAAGILKMLFTWLDTGMKETPEELSKIYTSIVKSKPDFF
ncbi:MAG: TetR/AcrR family transcriptional regulator [Bacteroidales bacterium]